jgi:hypothetical protein
MVGVGVVIAILWVVNRGSQTSITKNGRTIVLLPLINKGEAPREEAANVPAVDTPIILASPTLLVGVASLEPPSFTPALLSPTIAVAQVSQSTASISQPSQSPTRTARPSATTISALTSTSSPTSTRQANPQTGGTPTSTSPATGQPASLTIQNDQGCVDNRLTVLYIYGEIANNSSQAYDVKNINVRVFDAAGEMEVSNVFFDIPNPFFVFPNSSIPFVLYARIARPQPTRYELSLDTQPGRHTPRGDLRVDEYTTSRIQDLTQISGKWSYTDLITPLDFVSLIAVSYNAQGQVANLGYLYIPDVTASGSQLAPGQYSFDNLMLEYSPCDQGNIVLTIIGE